MLENQLHWMVVTNFPNDGILLIVFITELPWQYSLYPNNIPHLHPDSAQHLLCRHLRHSATDWYDQYQQLELYYHVCKISLNISILGPKVVHVVVPLSCYNVGTWMKLSPLKLSDCWKPSLSSCQHLSE